MDNKRNRLLELVEKDALKNILKSFTNATGLTANIVDIEGRSIFSKDDAQQNCEFCQLIWQYQKQKSMHRCSAAYARAGRQAAMFGEPYIFRCPAGLVEWAAPIVIDGEHLGSIICGQVLMWEPEDFFWIEVQAMNRNITDDFAPLIEAAKKLKVVSGEKVQASADLLFVAANYIMKSGWESLRQRQEIARQQSLLNEEIQNRKALEKKLNDQNMALTYSLNKERELVSKIKLDDYEEAKRAFRELLADIFIVGAAKLSSVKARTLELLVVVSRGAVDAGAEFEHILEINAEVMQAIALQSTVEEIDMKAINALEKYMQAVHRNNKVKNHQIINKIKEYIRNNCCQNLTLEAIADSVYLSPYYTSRIFKEEQGITIMDYLTKVRIEEAKKYLRNPKYNIDEISEKLGYSDPSYFSKVFKRHVGLSPSQFRQKA